MRAAPLGLVLLGLVVVGLWVVGSAGAPDLAVSLTRMKGIYVPLILALTTACIGLRFIRWQYLMRRIGVRVPTRRNLVIYLASLVGIATPAYAGETVRAVLARRAFGIPVRTTLAAWVVERLLDFAAIALIGVAALTGSALVVAALAMAALLSAIWPTHPGPAEPSALGRPAVLFPTLGLTVLAWLPASLIIIIVAEALGVSLAVPHGIRVFAASTFGGGLSLLPAGIAATGSLGIVQLQALGMASVEAVAIISVFRLATAGATLAAGGAFLIVELRGTRNAPPEEHFDQIAGEYLNQFEPHIWDLLLERKTALICSALPAHQGATGLDMGCGLGRQALALKERGHRVIGIDPAYHLVQGGAGTGVELIAGNGLELPFADSSLDFVYTVGVLHHLTGRGQQAAATREVQRVLRPGGVFIVHETNPRNPLFRLYMGYVFPLLRSIDEGIERWLHPASWTRTEGFNLERVEYFTFVPDFLPRFLLRLVLPVERWLERGRFRAYSAHYMAVLRKSRAAGAEPVSAASAERAVAAV
jgi:ubiquinone/menaquinone biosynthesis C-methylase UbiE